MDTRFRPLVRPCQLVFKHSSRPALDKTGYTAVEGGGGGGGGRNRPLDGRNGDETQQMIRRAIMAAVISTMDAILPGEFRYRIVYFHRWILKNWIDVNGFPDFRTIHDSGTKKKIHKYRKFYRKYSYIYYRFWRLSV